MPLWLILFLFGFIDPENGLEIIYEGNALSDEFYTDHLENIYFVDGHKIIKIEAARNEILEYGSLSAGAISATDVSNPFQILIFYRDFNKVVFLDNKLALLRSAIKLSDLGIEQAVLVCSSVKGGLWVFSDRDNRLIYYDQQLRNSHQSLIISSITRLNTKPVYMTEAKNHLYLNVPGSGILVFDRFAFYLKTIPYSGPERFQVIGGKIVYFLEGKLFSLNIENNELKSVILPSGMKIDNAQLQSKRLYILSGNIIRSFSIQKP